MADILESVSDLLTNNWTASNTGNRTPEIKPVFEAKRSDLGFSDKDIIVLYEESNIPQDIAIGGSNKRRVNIVVVDIRTMKTRAQAVLIWKEVERIIVANEKNDPFGDATADILDITDIKDLSDKTNKLWRFVLKLRIEKFIEVF